MTVASIEPHGRRNVLKGIRDRDLQRRRVRAVRLDPCRYA
jgi:hypothetical protein